MIIILSSVSLTPASSQFGIFKIFRILRVLRLINRNESLKIVIKAILYAFPDIFNVVIILLFFFIIFGIVTVSYFKGKLYYCVTD